MTIHVLQWIMEDLNKNGDSMENYTLQELKPLLEYYNSKFNKQYLEESIIMNLCYREYKEVSPDPIFKVRIEELRKERGLSKKNYQNYLDQEEVR